jgi:hypothetical protein
MQGAILSLFGVSLAVSLCELLLPGDAANASKRALRSLASLATLLIILTPFVGFLKNGDKLLPSLALPTEQALAPYEEILRKAVEAQSAEDLAGGIAGLLAAEYSCSADAFAVTVCFDDTGTPERICVRLSGKGLLLDPAEPESFLRERFHCTVEVR